MRENLAIEGYAFRRTNERKKYDTEIVFSHSGRMHRGVIKDISLGGAHIETYGVDRFDKGDIVTVSIPFTSGRKNIKRRGRIVWLNDEGFAIEFIGPTEAARS